MLPVRRVQRTQIPHRRASSAEPIPPTGSLRSHSISMPLISDGTGTALDSASLATEHIVVNRTCHDCPSSHRRIARQRRRGHHFRSDPRSGTDKQKDSGLLLAIGDTVTLNRKTAMACRRHPHRRRRQKPRDSMTRTPTAHFRCGTTGCLTGSRFRTEKDIPLFRPHEAAHEKRTKTRCA